MSLTRKHHKGIAMADFALIVGYFLFLILTTMEISMYLYAYNINNYLAQQALRYAVVRGNQAYDDDNSRTDAPANQADIQNYVNEIKGHGGAFQVTLNLPNASQDPGDPIRITVTHAYNPILLPGSVWQHTISTTSEGTILY